jgi:tRNA1(Val) A37 N6-methylase TrmN6
MRKTAPEASTLQKEGETLDDILEGGLRIFQKKRGYRFSIDALLLTHFVRLKKGDYIVDLGTGSGVIAVIVAAKSSVLIFRKNWLTWRNEAWQ